MNAAGASLALPLSVDEKQAIQSTGLFRTTLSSSDVQIVLEQLHNSRWRSRRPGYDQDGKEHFVDSNLRAFGTFTIAPVSWNAALLHMNGWWVASITFEGQALAEIEWHQADGQSIAWCNEVAIAEAASLR